MSVHCRGKTAGAPPHAGVRKKLIVGGLSVGVCLVSACSSEDPLLAELEGSNAERTVVSLRDVYGNEWEKFALACPNMPSAVTASTLGIAPEGLPDYSGADHLNAIVRWNSETLEVSEFPVTQVRLCTSDSSWSPEISDPVVVFQSTTDGGWVLQ